MTLTLSQARDAVAGFINTEWTTNGVTSSYPLLWQNVVGDKPGESGSTTEATAWGRATINILASPQSTQGRRRYLTTGSAVVQVFTHVGDGFTLSDSISEELLNLFRQHVGSTGQFWFFDISQQEIGVDGPWFQVNVGASFNFQEVP